MSLAQLYETAWRMTVQADASQEQATWTNSEPGVVGGLEAMTAAEFAQQVDYPYDETMIWGTEGVGTPVSEGGGGTA